MANILFLAHRIPYPPNKGDKIRSWNFLAHLARNHVVHAAFYVDDAKDMKHLDVLDDICASVQYRQVSPLQQRFLALRGLLNGSSLTEYAYPTRALANKLKPLFDTGQIDLCFVFSAGAYRLVPASFTGPVIVDLVDVDSQKWSAYAHASSFPVANLYAREARKLLAYECEIAQKAARTLFVSADEATLFKSLCRTRQDRISFVSNGVDASVFNPERYSVQSRDVVIFTGAMDYQPNVEAVVWFCEQVWPKIKAHHTNAEFHIAGGPENERVKALEETEGVKVLGYVDDMAGEIAKARVAVAPLLTARGIQNKVLEAMAMAKPVVCTPQANEGIDGENQAALFVEHDAAAFAQRVNDLLGHETACRSVGASAREFVLRRFSWESSFSSLDTFIDEALS